MKIVVIEDQIDLQEELVYFLCRLGHQASGVSSGIELAQSMRHSRPDLLLLDIGLPGEDGIAIAERLRDTPGLAIVMLTARSGNEDRIRSFESGADTFLVKPVSHRELQAVLVRANQRLNPDAKSKSARWQLLRRQRLLTSPDGVTMTLTGSELCLLETLAQQVGHTVTRRELIEAMGYDFMSFDERRIEVKISRLRKKIRDATLTQDLIQSEWGVGYALTAECLIS